MIVLARRADRLGGRLCAIVNGMRLAQALGADFRFGWPKDKYHFENLDDVDRLLDPSFIEAFLMPEEDVKALGAVRLDLFDPAAPPPKAVLVDTPAGVALLPGEDRPEAARQCREVFASSRMVAPHILEAVETLAERLGLTGDRRVVALHIRRGDVVHRYRVGVVAPDFFARYNPVQFYLDWGARALAEGTADGFVVFSEDEGVRQLMTTRLDGARACDTATACPGLTELEVALVEMLLMARCPLIVGGYSAFNHFPCLVGTPQKRSIREELTPEQRQQALAAAAAGSDLIGHEADFVSVLMLLEGLQAGRSDAMDGFVERAREKEEILAPAGALLLAEGFAGEAAILLRMALGGSPLMPTNVAQDLALALLDQGRHAEALEALELALARQPGRWDLVRTRGRILIAQGQRAEGLALLRQAADTAPTHFRAAARATLDEALASANA